jgi:hypothetical protein
VPPAAVYTLDAETGSFTETGNDATLAPTRSLTASAGTFSLAGNDVLATAERVLSLAAAAILLVGNAADLTFASATTRGEITWSNHGATILTVESSRPSFETTVLSQHPSTILSVTAAMAILHVGNTNIIDFYFRDYDTRALTDPTTVQVTVKPRKSGASTTYTYGTDANLTKTATGSYRIAINCTAADTWDFVILSPGPTAKCSGSGSFVVNALPIA